MVLFNINNIADNYFMDGTNEIPYTVSLNPCKVDDTMVISFENECRKYKDKQIMVNLDLTIKLENNNYDHSITPENPCYLELQFD
jgi:hypothetical protein